MNGVFFFFVVEDLCEGEGVSERRKDEFSCRESGFFFGGGGGGGARGGRKGCGLV